MEKKIPVTLIIVSIIAVLMDCYAGYNFFLMMAMPMMVSLQYFSYVVVLGIPMLFIISVINLFRLKKWAYMMFFVFTFILHSFLGYIYIFLV